MNKWLAVSYFSQAFQQLSSSEQRTLCSDEDVQAAVISALNRPADTQTTTIVSQAKSIAFERCFVEMKAALIKESAIDSPLFANVCQELADRQALSAFKLAKCAAK